MTNDEKLELAEQVNGPVREVLHRMMTIVERILDRVEVLELERMHRREVPACTPNAPPED
jgi:hypothetical protein